MLLKAYSIYDRKALQYHPPFFASTDGSAARSFADAANDPQTSFGRHPADYVLFCVGEYDDAKGELVAYNPLVHVADATALLEKKTVDMFTKKERA